MKILVVDDSTAMRKLIARSLGSSGARDVEVVEATDGMQALAMIARHGSSIDLILCDMNMPNVDGLSLLRSLRGPPPPRPPAEAADCADLQSARQIPFVIVTADESDESTARALREGAAGVIGKPFRMEVMAALVRRYRSHGRCGTSGGSKTDTETGESHVLAGGTAGNAQAAISRPPSLKYVARLACPAVVSGRSAAKAQRDSVRPRWVLCGQTADSPVPRKVRSGLSLSWKGGGDGRGTEGSRGGQAAGGSKG